MTCISSRKFIAADSNLSQLHFLLLTKVRRGEQLAIIYNAGRFFDHYEKKNLTELLDYRSDLIENAVSRFLLRLGLLILIGGLAVVVKTVYAFVVLVPIIYLLKSEIGIVRTACRHDYALKDYIRVLQGSSPIRRSTFIKSMVENASRIAECNG